MKNRAWIFTLTFLNTLILCITQLPTVFTDPTPHAVLTVGFYTLSYIAQNFLFSCLLSVILLPIFLFSSEDKLKIMISIVPVTGALFFNFMNAKIFSFWRDFVNSSMLGMYFTKGGSQVFEMSRAMHIWIAMAVILFVLMGSGVVLIAKKYRSYFNVKRWLGFFICIYIIAQSLFVFLSRQDDMRFLQYTIKIPYFYDFSWVNVLQKMRIPILPKNSPQEELRLLLAKDKKLDYPLHPLQYHLPQHPLNVLLIVVDTLRYDMINPVNMPNTYHFAQTADQFLDNSSGGDCTRPGIFSLFYGIPTTYWNSAFTHRTGSIVIRAFQANHYQLGIYASAPLLSPPFQKTVFATVSHLQVMTPGKTSLDRDIKITQEMQGFLNQAAENHKPFFGFMFYDAPHAYNSLPIHHPFYPTQSLNYFDVDNKTNRTPIYNLYKNAVFADDQLIEKVLATVKADDLSHNTVIIITADHGQEFNDDHNNYWEHASGFSKYQMRTPMIIAWPNRKPAVFHDTTTHFDLAPTLLKHALGVTNPISDYSVGDDFFSKKQPKFVIAGNYAYFALITNQNIMQFHNSGLYRFTDATMKSLPDEKITPSDFAHLTREMTAFESH